MGVAVFLFSFIVALFFVSAVVFVFVLAVKIEVQASPKPLELPEWTGRERESLGADLEAAKRDFIGVPGKSWEEHKREYPDIKPTNVITSVLQDKFERHGIFPEALEAYLEEQK